MGFGALAPDLDVIAPVRDYAWTREKAIEFAEQNEIPINVTKKSPFSIDQNVWGRAVETGFLEDLWNAPTKDVYDYTEDPTLNFAAPDEVTVSSRPASRWPRRPPGHRARGDQELNAAAAPGRRPYRHGRGPSRRYQEREIYEAPGAMVSSPRTRRPRT